MKLKHIFVGSLYLLLNISLSPASDGDRLRYLQQDSPYYPSHTFPKLTTPQWIGDDGIEAAVVFAIDDLRNNAEHFESYLRPLLNRLKQIDGRSPVSIMTNQIPKEHPLLQQWLKEGLSLETHTWTHPCPCLQGGDFDAARDTYEKCIDWMHQVPNNQPVAFRLTCLDIWNTNSPRFYTELFNKTTSEGRFLRVSSSVQLAFNRDDPSLPRRLTVDEEGRERFAKYFNQGVDVFGRPNYHYGNVVYNYPYPFVVSRLCWEIPCLVSDHTAAIYHGRYGNHTLRDWQAALDAAVLKKGVFAICFHATNRITPVELIAFVDHAVKRYGNKVTFLNFAEVQQRISQHLLAGQTLRAPNGRDNGVRLLDLNNDGYLDVLIGNQNLQKTRIWEPNLGKWKTTSLPTRIVAADAQANQRETGVRFGILGDSDQPVMLVRNESSQGGWRCNGGRWVEDASLLAGLQIDGKEVMTQSGGRDRGVRLLDLNRDGRCELIVSNSKLSAIFVRSVDDTTWRRAPFTLPNDVQIVDDQGKDAGLRLVDLNGDGFEDVLFSNDDRYALHYYADMRNGWTAKSCAARRSNNPWEIPRIVRNGTNNGAWFASNQMWVHNEHTAALNDHAIIIPFSQMDERMRFRRGLQMLTQWRVLGPFPNDQQKAFITDFGPEQDPGAIQTDKIYHGVDDRPITWQDGTATPIGGGQGFDLNKFCKDNKFRTNDLIVYLAATVVSPLDQRAKILLGSEDGVKVFLNGRLIHSNFVRRSTRLGDDQISIDLKKGENLLLIKLEQIGAGGGVVAALLAEHAIMQMDKPAD